MRTIKLLITLVLLGLSYNSFAQCAYGIPNNPGCIPPTHWYPQQGGSGNGGGNSKSNNGGYYSPQRWEDRWGAIYIDFDTPTGGIGTSNDMTSKRKAVNLALERCVASGGDKKKCKEASVYKNGCVALARSTGAWLFPRSYESSSTDSLERVTKISLSACQAKDTGECEIIYAECSKAQFY